MSKPPAPCLSLVIDATSPDEITEKIRAVGWSNDYDQILAGAFRGSVEVAQVGASQVAGISYTNQILARGSPPPGCVTLAVVEEVQGPARWRGHEVTPGFTLVADESVEIDLLMGRRFVLWLLVVPEALVGEEASVRPVVDKLDIAPAMRRRIVAHIRSGLALTRNAAAAPMSQDAIALFEQRGVELARGALSGLGTLSTSPPVADRLYTLLRTEGAEMLSVPQIAQRIGVSDRTLRRASRDAFNCSPLRLGKFLRLNAIRRELEASRPGDTRVWEVAGRHGFWHMGQLGRDFRRLFGASPSAVLVAERALPLP